jgi:3-methyl-2-oxobutanoate hydroxymethyltransferase
LIKDALAVEAAGAFAVVVEMVPREVAQEITESLGIPTIGIGAGPETDGQILVWTDMAGLGTRRVPSFVKQYSNLHAELSRAAGAWRDDVAEGKFPADEHSFTES